MKKKFLFFFIFFYFIFNIEGNGKEQFDVEKIECISKFYKEDDWTRNYYKKINFKQTYDKRKFIIEKKLNVKTEEVLYCLEIFGGRTKCLTSDYNNKISYKYIPYEFNESNMNQETYNQLKTIKEEFIYNITDETYYKKTSRWNNHFNYLWHIEVRGSCELL